MKKFTLITIILFSILAATEINGYIWVYKIDFNEKYVKDAWILKKCVKKRKGVLVVKKNTHLKAYPAHDARNMSIICRGQKVLVR